MSGSKRSSLGALVAILLAAWSPPAHAQDDAAPRALTLAETIAIARERAPAVHAALARIASSEAELDKAHAGHLPTLAIVGTGTAFVSQGTIFLAGLTSADASQQTLVGQGSLSLQWTLYDFGKTSSAIDAAKASIAASRLSARATEQRAMGEAAVAYYTLLADDGLVEAAEQARAEREHVEAITRRLVTAGFRSAVDETRAQVAVDVAKLDVAVAQATKDDDTAALASALMLDPRASFRLEAPPAPSVAAPVGDAAAVVSAKPEVAAARERLERAHHELDEARAGRLPNLAASGQGSVLYTRDRVQGVTTNMPSEFVSGALTLTIPLFDPLTSASVHAAEATIGDAEASLAQATGSARTEASLVARQLASSRAILEQSERLAVGTAANLVAMEERYANGVESPLALADAQREDALARVAIVKARLSLDVARVRLLAELSRMDELARR